MCHVSSPSSHAAMSGPRQAKGGVVATTNSRRPFYLAPSTMSKLGNGSSSVFPDAARTDISLEPVTKFPTLSDLSMSTGRAKSLPDLRLAFREANSTHKAYHRLQRFSRRQTFSAKIVAGPDYVESLNIGFSQEGLHSCSRCQNIDFDLRTLSLSQNEGCLDITYAEGGEAAKEGCELFLSLFDAADHRLGKFQTGRGHRWFDNIPHELLHKPIAFSINEEEISDTGQTKTMVHFKEIRTRRCGRSKWSFFQHDGQ